MSHALTTSSPSASPSHQSPTLDGRTAIDLDPKSSPITESAPTILQKDHLDGMTVTSESCIVPRSSLRHHHSMELIYVAPSNNAHDVFVAHISIRETEPLHIGARVGAWVSAHIPRWINSIPCTFSTSPAQSPTTLGQTSPPDATTNNLASSPPAISTPLCDECKAADILKDMENKMTNDLANTPEPNEDRDHYHPELFHEMVREHVRRESLS